ncbi:fibronectin type III domain-containing protein [Flavobacterium aurantiibacter]|uniref:Fibronectin type-III domain-containing protein n=1 Tax=Flavobacterium aurantiibacter TaxID=2023067 RepID=A0A256A5R1_9FLAO|nr:fibronectin type III domain-containing protein [Flavobacterium aurantiibacter]OYQ49013.1 hypothetical protein CHX27_01815 [Flavobacterium aurantiibacter]
MKKITFIIAFLVLGAFESYSQCIRPIQYPSNTIVSNNSGFPQIIASDSYTKEYSQISGLTQGANYLFTCDLGGVNKHITVTDWSNNVIAFGDSPLTVEAITATQVRLHYADNAACGSTSASHLTTIMAVLDCSPPINLTATNISATSATLSWEPLGEETTWEVYVVTSGTPGPTANTVGQAFVNNPSYNEAILTPDTSYKFYVRTICGAETSPWNGPFNFASACEPVEAFSENFDGVDAFTLPACWTQVKNGTGSSDFSYTAVANWNAQSAPNSILMYNDSDGSAANLFLVAPEVTNLGAGTHRLKFFAKSDFGIVNMQFGTVSSNTPDATFTLVSAIDLTSTYTEYIIDYTVYNGTDNFIAIRHNGPQFSFVFFDDFRWELAPLCSDVSDITINNVTDTEASITWDSNGTESQWDVVFGGSDATDPAALTPITPAPTGTPQAILGGLTASTTYKVWVRSVCGDNLGAWIGPVTFQTTCTPVAEIIENFDTYSNFEMPDCWTQVLNGPGVSQFAYAQVTLGNSFSPSSVIQLYNFNSPTTANIMAVTPPLNNIGAGTHRLKFYAKSSLALGSLQVGTINSATAQGTFTPVATLPLTSTHNEFIVEFTDTTITDKYIAFRFNSPGTFNSIFIDDVRWEAIPNCEDVTGLAVTDVDVNTAAIAWEAGGSETEWDVVVGENTVTNPNTLTPVVPSTTGTPTTILEGLTANTVYKVWVRSVCGDNNGAWIGPISFRTSCPATDTINENFDSLPAGGIPNCWTGILSPGTSQLAYVKAETFNFNSPSRAMGLYDFDSPASANIILASPKLNNLSLGTYRLIFFARSGGATGSVQVGTVNNTLSDAVFTEIETIEITNTYSEYAVNFSPSTDTFIAFRHNTTGAFNIVFIDDVRWEPAPLCADVTNVNVVDITTDSATITWESQGNETNWQVVFGGIDDTDPNTLTPSPVLTTLDYTINELTENTEYNVWVRSVCGELNGNGNWIGPFTFFTTCNTTNVPYIQNFETANIPDIPNCSVIQNAGTGNDWITSTLTLYGFNSKVLQYPFNALNTANAWYFTQGVNLTEGTTYKISYLYGSNTSFFVEKMKVLYGLSPIAEEMTQQLADHTFLFNVAQINEETFTPAASGVYYFGFNAYSSANQNNIYLDNISIDIALPNDSFTDSDFNFYPNPVKDVLNLSYNQTIKNIEVFNFLGQRVHEYTVNSNNAQIDMSKLPTGSYLLKVASEDQLKTIKIVKQ